MIPIDMVPTGVILKQTTEIFLVVSNGFGTGYDVKWFVSARPFTTDRGLKSIIIFLFKQRGPGFGSVPTFNAIIEQRLNHAVESL